MVGLLQKNKAQSTAEYAILIALVVAAVVGMQTYVKRGLQARTHDATVDYTTAVSGAAGWSDRAPGRDAVAMKNQYEFDKAKSTSTQDLLVDKQTLTMQQGGAINREVNQTSQQAVDDYRQYDYDKVNN